MQFCTIECKFNPGRHDSSAGRKVAIIKDPDVIGDRMRSLLLEINEEAKDIGSGKGLESI